MYSTRMFDWNLGMIADLFRKDRKSVDLEVQWKRGFRSPNFALIYSEARLWIKKKTEPGTGTNFFLHVTIFK